MGNSPPTRTSLRLSNGDCSYQVELGRSISSVRFGGREVHQHDDNGVTETWEVSYMAGESKTYEAILTKQKNRLVCIAIYDTGNCFFYGWVEKVEATRLLSPVIASRYYPSVLFRMRSFKDELFKFSTTDARGNRTSTDVIFRRSDTKLGLLVWEWKTRSGEEWPYTGIVANYYVNKGKEGDGVGVSVALKRIRVLDDGNLDFAVDGPELHPVDALMYMFDQVIRTKTWKPSLCPHCAINIIQRQRDGIWQSDGEDSDANTNNVKPFAHGSSSQNNARGLVTNGGKLSGNNNCNLNVNNFIVRGRGR